MHRTLGLRRTQEGDGGSRRVEHGASRPEQCPELAVLRGPQQRLGFPGQQAGPAVREEAAVDGVEAETLSGA